MNLDNLSMEEQILLENEVRNCDFEKGRASFGHVIEINGPTTNLGSLRHEAIKRYADQIRKLDSEKQVISFPRI